MALDDEIINIHFFKEREECLEYLKKMYIDNLRLRNKMALDDEIDKINKITI
jgi:hypothetical protein